MGVGYKFKASSGSAVDLTSTTVNPGAAPTSTPRQGGFTLRNRINFANVTSANKTLWTIDASSASSASQVANKLRVLEIPKRVLVKNVHFYNVASHSVMATSVSFATAASVGSSAFSGLQIGINAELNKKPTSSASYAAASHLIWVTGTQAKHFNDAKAGLALGGIPLTKKTLAITYTLKKIDSSISSATTPGIADMPAFLNNSESDPQQTPGLYFPYGGFVTLAAGPHNTATGSATASKVASGSSDATLKLAGVWEVQASCQYVPE